MLAKGLLIILALEAVGLAILAWDWSAGQPFVAAVLLLGLLISLWLTVALASTCATYAIARASVPPLRAVAWPPARTLLCETLASALLFVLFQPFAKWVCLRRARLPTPQRKTRVVFVHGYFCNSGLWYLHHEALEARGYACSAPDLEPPWGSIDLFACQLREHLEALRRETPEAPIVVIAHSMGGLVARKAFVGDEPTTVAKLVTLGTPHHGTKLAAWGLGQCARQMQPDGAWIKALNEAERPRIPITSIWSRHDNFMAPVETPELAGSRTVCIEGIGHLSLALSIGVSQLLVDEVEAVERAARQPV